MENVLVLEIILIINLDFLQEEVFQFQLEFISLQIQKMKKNSKSLI